jgi:hypothetical protein
VAAAAIAAVALAVWLIALRDPAAPEDRAAALVPSGALVYAHLSTDPGRGEDGRFLEVLGRLPGVRALTARLQTQIGAAFRYERDVRPWLGKEAAVALLDSGRPAADTLVLLSVDDEPKAQGLLFRVAGAKGGVEHRGIAVRRFGSVAAAFVGGFLAIGQEDVVKRAIDLHAGSGTALSANAAFSASDPPPERVLQVWAPAEGVRRVLAAQSGILGAVGSALEGPAMRAVSLSAAPSDRGLRVWVRRQQRVAPTAPPFEPSLIDTVPADAAAYLSVGGLDPLAPLLDRVQAFLGANAAYDVRRQLGSALRGEVAIWAAPGLPVPLVTLVARTRSDRAARDASARLMGALAAALTPTGSADAGQVPTLETRRVAGVDATVLRLGPGAELLSAVTGGRMVLTTGEAGIARSKGASDGLRDADRFRRVVTSLPDRGEALAFADLAQLLTLGEQTGLLTGAASAASLEDLRRIRAVGAVAERVSSDTTAEFLFEIP